MTNGDTQNKLDWVFNRNSDTNAILRELGKGINSRIFIGKHTMLSFVTIEPNSEGSFHKHPEEQWGILLEGKCIRIQNNKEIAMVPGDFWYSAPNVPHGIRTGEEKAIILDIFSPPRPAYRSTGQGFDE